MKYTICFLVGFIFLGITAVYKPIFINYPFLYYFLACLSIYLLLVHIQGIFKLSYKVFLAGVILLESVFWLAIAYTIHFKKYDTSYHDFFFDFNIFHHRKLAQFSNACEYDETLFYKIKPNINEPFNALDFSTKIISNSKGTRDDENSLNNPKIICIGDSFTMGWGVENNETFAAELEKNTQLKTLNLGLSSYGTYREYQILKRFPSDSLKCIVIQYHYSDVEENYQKMKDLAENKSDKTSLTKEDFANQVKNDKFNSAYFPLKGLHYIFSENLIKFRTWARNKITNKQTKQLKGNTAQLTTSKPAFDWYDGEDNLRNFDKVLQKIRADYKVPIVIFCMGSPVRIQDKFTSFYNNPTTKQSNIYFIPMTLERDNFFVLDDHLTPSGHKKVAEILSKEITKIIK